jgi:hypothetical protein
MTLENDALMEWLRVQMLRLRSFDWGRGSWSTHWLKDGVAKFGANYSIETLGTQLCVSEDEILTFIESPAALKEMASKSFTVSWTGKGLTLSWLEEGIRETKTDVSQDFFEKDGAYFVSSRWVGKIVYLDGIERTVSDSGMMGPAKITKEQFLAELKRIESQAAR